jgi:hypothetical protein
MSSAMALRRSTNECSARRSTLLTQGETMPPFQNIVAAVDLTEASNDVFEAPLQLAGAQHARVHLIHVVPDALHAAWLLDAAGPVRPEVQHRWTDDSEQRFRSRPRCRSAERTDRRPRRDPLEPDRGLLARAHGRCDRARVPRPRCHGTFRARQRLRAGHAAGRLPGDDRSASATTCDVARDRDRVRRRSLTCACRMHTPRTRSWFSRL